ncbi:hypothetical protein [Thermaurantimonas aggregans]|uniref:hypothetical protein n=1 Tax=Thermaurantimonas aggregans TaxID=2173829 RepID=UPI001359494F|nr:hypothetical protein [Thermaurantimonas aggregans]MCX8149092.1 hypothetical protein [Thermaurantimonas aggregans]
MGAKRVLTKTFRIVSIFDSIRVALSRRSQLLLPYLDRLNGCGAYGDFAWSTPK